MAGGDGGVVPNAIVGHRDLWPTACPGDAFYPRLGELRNAVQPRIGWEGGGTETTSPVRWIPEG